MEDDDLLASGIFGDVSSDRLIEVGWIWYEFSTVG